MAAAAGIIPVAVIIPPPQPEIDQLTQILEWIRFADAGDCTEIIQDIFTTYDAVLAMTEKGITELSASFSRRTVTNGRIHFGIHHTKKLKHMLHHIYFFFFCIPGISVCTLLVYIL